MEPLKPFTEKGQTLIKDIPKKDKVEELAIRKLKDQADGTFALYLVSKKWTISYVQEGRIQKRQLDDREVQDISLVREALQLKKGEVLAEDYELEDSGIAQLNLAKARDLFVDEEIPKDKSVKIPGVNGITILIDPHNDETAGSATHAFTDELERSFLLAIREPTAGCPLITSPHLIKNALERHSFTLRDLVSKYYFYQNKSKSYLVLLPKEPKNLTPNSLCLKNLTLLHESLIEGAISIQIDSTPYIDLKSLFHRSPEQIPPRLALYLGGHGSEEEVMGLPDAEYYDLMSHLDSTYSISGALVGTCNPHGALPSIKGIFIQQGIPHMTVDEVETNIPKFLEILNSIKKEHILTKEGQKRIGEALKVLSVEKESNRATVHYAGKFATRRTHELPNSVNFTYQKMQIEQGKRKSGEPIVIPRTKELFHLFVPDASEVDLEVAGDNLVFVSEIRENSYHVLRSVTLKNSRVVHNLDDFVKKAFEINFEHLQEIVLSDAEHLFLIKKIIIDNVTYEDVLITIEEDEDEEDEPILNWSYLKRSPALGAGDPPDPHQLLKEGDKSAEDQFLEYVLNNLKCTTPSEAALKEATGGSQTHQSALASIQKLFFPTKEWVAYLDFPELLEKYLDRLDKDQIDDHSMTRLINHFLDNNEFLNHPKILDKLFQLRPDWTRLYSYENEEKCINAVLSITDNTFTDEEMRKIKCSFHFAPLAVKKRLVNAKIDNRCNLFDMVISHLNLDLVKVFLKYGAYSPEQVGISKALSESVPLEKHAILSNILELLIAEQIKREGNILGADARTVSEPANQLITRKGIISALWLNVEESAIEPFMRIYEKDVKEMLARGRMTREMEVFTESLIEAACARSNGNFLGRLLTLLPPTNQLSEEMQKNLKFYNFTDLLERDHSFSLLQLLLNKGWLQPVEYMNKLIDSNSLEPLALLVKSGRMKEEDWQKLDLANTLRVQGTPQEKREQIAQYLREKAIKNDCLELYEALDAPLYHNAWNDREFELQMQSAKASPNILVYLVKIWIARHPGSPRLFQIIGSFSQLGAVVAQKLLEIDFLPNEFSLLPVLTTATREYHLSEESGEFLKRQLNKGILLTRLAIDRLLDLPSLEIYKVVFERYIRESLLACKSEREFLQQFAKYLKEDHDKMDYLKSQWDSLVKIRKQMAETQINQFSEIQMNLFLEEAEKSTNPLYHYIFLLCLPAWLQDHPHETLQLLDKVLAKIEGTDQDAITDYLKRDSREKESLEIDFPIINKTEILLRFLGVCIDRKTKPTHDQIKRIEDLGYLVSLSDEEAYNNLVIALKALPDDYRVEEAA